ncbi:MAG: deoxyhypusine synthase family protein [Candidatus Omnitrophica bacterium]|nr:deoxyhypusine synthase family protein [Candidatus Omnitrophota bacterium]
MLKLNYVKTYSLKQRASKVNIGDFAKPPSKSSSFNTFYKSLPRILKGNDLRGVVTAIARARRAKKPVILMMGAHVIKCGLNPVIIELIKKKVITCIAVNGACLIHDFEVAYQGKTSEDVAKSLEKGEFGMGRETADFINEAIRQGVSAGRGCAESLARKIANSKLPYGRLSLLGNAYKYKVPVTCHVAIGTDIIHQHPSFDGALTGEGSLRDFYILAEEISGLEGGVVLNFGSAVILPEVFLKALNLARNLGFKVRNFTTANFDMNYHYRPAENIVRRPVLSSGRGYYIIGHHEIMLPLLAQAVVEELKR